MTLPLARLAPRERRAILIALGVIAAAWLGTRGLPSVLRAARDAQARRSGAGELLVRARQTIAEDPVARDSLASLARRLVGTATMLFGGGSAGESVAEFSALVTGLAERNGLRIVRQDAQPDTGQAPFQQLRLRAEAEGDLVGLAGWLAHLEEGPKLIVVRSLSLSGGSGPAPSSHPERLRIQVDLVSFASPIAAVTP